MCDIKDVLLLALLIFAIGSLGVIVNRKSFISLLMSIELMLLSVNINFAALASYHHDYNGQIFVIFILTVAAAEAAVGLAILVAYFRNRDSIDTASANHLRG